MKRQGIIALVLVLLIAASFGTYFLVDSYQNKKEREQAEEAAALQLSSFQSSDVTKLVLHTPELDYTIVKDESTEDWVVSDGNELHINTYYIDALCTYGSTLTASEDLGAADQETLKQYELDDPITITYYTADGETTLSIGCQTPTKNSFYLMKENSDHVYLVSADIAGYLYVTETQLRYRYVMEDKDSHFQRISLQHNGEYVYAMELEEDASWRATEPCETNLLVDGAALSNLFTLLTQLEIDDFGDSNLTEADYAEYGFDNPAYVLQFEQESGEITTLYFEEYDPLVTSNVNCLRVETGEILIFESNYISFLQNTLTDYMTGTVCKLDINEVAKLHLQYQGTFNDKTLDLDTVFTLDTENEQYSCDDTAFSGEDAETVEAFKDFYSTLADLSYESIDASGEVPEGTDPAFRLEYTMQDGASHVVELVVHDDTTYWAYVDGEFTHALVRQRALSGENKAFEKYTAFTKALEKAAA